MQSAVTLAATRTDTCSLITNLLHLWGITAGNFMFSNSALAGGDTTKHHLFLIISVTRILTHNVIIC